MQSQTVILDRDHLARQTMEDEDLQREVLQLFTDQMVLKLGQLDVGVVDRKEYAHSIKGAAKGIGAWQVAHAAEALEAGKGDTQNLVQALRLAVDETLLEIRSILNT
ncbi:Hpt domain-containing protein [Cohaesibacter celericrescens]|uniref:HPt domain-containing protein n=1 Tax=Cohaesibacter celericrescens TaxID=2067669 RepID=A0A2N5XLZ9_9HYPH|nr:Hpt domain-containing protein [Cohaesibacter celericrescens]PLW75458.1 hypothetical protein C0081_19125 [Cohaesibacter celericrescens]PLW78865.1 hypothetical protein C0081_01085 [Cohaesibacter celericrescens]